MNTALMERPTVAPALPRAAGLVEVRVVGAHEEHLVQRVFDGLDERSRAARFGRGTPRLSPALRRELTRNVPGERVALVALSQGRAVGLGGWVRDENDPGTADLSAAVVDAAQERGVGRRLVHELAATADRQGVDWFRVPARVANGRVGSWLDAMGARRSDREVLVHVRTALARTS